MAVLKRADVPNQIPQLWAADLFSQAENLTFWQRFEGPEGSSMPLIRKDDLEQQAGDTIKIDIVLALTGTGATGDTALLDGNEEKMAFRQFSFAVDSLQHALRWSKLGKILINKNMRGTAVNQLSKWLAGKLDDRCMATFTGMTVGGFTPSLATAALPTTMNWFAGTATTAATVADTDAAGRLKLNDISDIKAYAQTNNKIEPLRMDNGEEVFGLVLHPYSALALKKDTQWQQAQREAQARGADNPLFTGAVGMWDGVVIYVSNRIPTAGDGVGSIAVARNIFFGSQAQVRGFAYYPDWTEQYFSYGQEQGIATFTVLGQRLTVFDLNAAETTGTSVDDTAIGSMILFTSAVAPVA
jgi:N4-gp56 family major capsid protein